MNRKLTKAGLIEAIKDYPDDAPIAVAVGLHSANLPTTSYAWLEDTDDVHARKPLVWSVSNHPDAIILEL